MKLVALFVAASLAATNLCLGGEAITNKMATAEVKKAVSRLPLGAADNEVELFMSTNHLAPTYTLSVTRSPTLSRSYLLSDGCWLIIETPGGALRSASIQSNGVTIATIKLPKKP